MTMLKPMMILRSLSLLTVLVAPALAQAQDHRLRVSLGGAITAGAIDGEPAIVASVGFRFANRLSFDVEVTAAEDSAGRFPTAQFLGEGISRAILGGLAQFPGDIQRGVITPMPPIGGLAQGSRAAMPIAIEGFRAERDGSMALATFGLRYELPTQVERFVPYVTGGIGIARTAEDLRILPAAATSVRPGVGAAMLPTRAFRQETSHTGLATSAGIGASIRLFKQLSADLDARYVRLDGARNLGRFGGGVSYRF
jgi:opacity protein-like surface antigen